MSGGGWDEIDDPAMHNRISAAVALIFEHADPRAIHADKAADGSDLRDVLFDSDGAAVHAWDLFEGVGPGHASASRRADYVRASDGCRTAASAFGDGHTVWFSDELGVTTKEFAAGLERFAAHVASREATS